MTALAGLLGAAAVIAWIGAVMDIGAALSGGAWGNAIGSVILAIVLSAVGAGVRSFALAREGRKTAYILQRAGASSPSLAGAIEYFSTPRYQHSVRPPAAHPTPVDAGGTMLLLLSWACMIGGVVLAAIGLLFARSWGMLIIGVVLLLLVGPIHAWQKSRYATHVLRVYERQMLIRPAEPSQELRHVLWSVAQTLARKGSSREQHAAYIIEMYVELVGAWSENHR